MLNTIASKIKSFEEIRALVLEARKNKKRIVLTNGVFDLLHHGHTKYLRKAKQLGDILIVGINSDSSTKINKGEQRPILHENERLEIISSLEDVDYVFLFPEKVVSKYLRELKPEIYCKGSDYAQVIDSNTSTNTSQKPQIYPELFEIAREYGGQISIIEVDTDSSSSDIIDRVRKKFLSHNI